MKLTITDQKTGSDLLLFSGEQNLDRFFYSRDKEKKYFTIAWNKNPDIEPAVYKRSKTKVTELKGSHVVFMSQAEAVAKVIIAAAENASKEK